MFGLYCFSFCMVLSLQASLGAQQIKSLSWELESSLHFTTQNNN